MNINDVPVVVPTTWSWPTLNVIQDLLERRCKVFRGFCELEATQGFLAYPTALSSSKGQDMVRILTTRVLEEILESQEASDPAHVLEELIDALNFLLAIACLDEETPRLLLCTQMAKAVDPYPLQRLEATYSGSAALKAFLLNLNPMLETLRNRAWQRRTQSLYFEGWEPLINFIVAVWRAIVMEFDSWEQFCWFYVAKEAVLQFRLTTNY